MLSSVALVVACGGDDGGTTGGSATSTTSGGTVATDSTSSTTSTSAGTDGGSSGGGSMGTSATTNGTSSGGSSGGGTTGGGGSAGCGSPSLGPGTHDNIQVDVDGETREYNLFVPTTYDPNTPAPLVLNFHGLMGTPEGQADFSQFNDTAEPRGMLVAYPRGIGESFNAGACCGTAASNDVDDVGFARALVAQVEAQHCVDPKRVYATGMSNGGHMAHTLGCEAADVFAAVAPVSGVMGLSSCTPARPISVLDFHGTGDLIVLYGGAGPGFPPVPDMMADWAARNGCDAQSMVSLSVDDVECETWPNCDGDVEVTLCTTGAGHCWPGGGTCFFGTKTDAVDASEMMADMFEAHPLP